MELIRDQIFEGMSFSRDAFPKAEYENCTFKGCDLSRAFLGQYIFLECTFQDCDLSSAQINDTAFREARFENCKMLGLRFTECNSFMMSMEFHGCQLDLSDWHHMDMSQLSFIHCSMKECDLEGSDLRKTHISRCDMDQCRIRETNMEGLNLHGNYNVSFDPAENKVKGMQLGRDQVDGILLKWGIRIRN